MIPSWAYFLHALHYVFAHKHGGRCNERLRDLHAYTWLSCAFGVNKTILLMVLCTGKKARRDQGSSRDQALRGGARVEEHACHE